jgi:hypothetical protein
MNVMEKETESLITAQKMINGVVLFVRRRSND